MPEQYKAGKTIQNYKILEHVGTGNYASSYFAEDTRDGKKVFFKQYIDPTEFSGDIFKQFVNQQRRLEEILKEIDDAENILETFEIKGIHHQAKEFMEGKDLRKYFEEKKSLALEERYLIAIVSVYALMKIHEKKIIHNDLKPEQIYLHEDPAIEMKYRVKISDFDFSTVEGEYEPVDRVSTPFYSSPECLKEEPSGYASDIFTMGIVLYEIIVGDYPYEVTTQEEYEESVYKQKARKAKELNPNLSNEMSELIYNCLNPDSNSRPKLKEIHEALTRLVRPGTEPPVAEPPVPPTSEPPQPPEEKIPLRVEFSSAEYDLKPSIHQSTIVGREWCRAFPSYAYVSPEQFELKKEEKTWKIKGIEGAINSTYLNGEDISGVDRDLKDGDEILIGNRETRKGLILKVKFVY